MTIETGTGSDEPGSPDPGGPEGPAAVVTTGSRHARNAHRRPNRLAEALRTTSPGLSRAWRTILQCTLLALVLLIASTGALSAFRFPVFSPIDEGAHFAYVQQIAEHGTLPVLGRTPMSPQVLAISQGRYPRPTTFDPVKIGLGGLSYEAFQPPLFYISAVPAFAVVGNYRGKVYAVRFYQYLLLLVTVVLAGRLARVVLRDRWMLGWGMLLVFLAFPYIVVRFTTVGNLALAIPLTILFATELWIAWERHAASRYVVSGVLGGLCVLTQLELVVLLPVLLLVLVAEARSHRRTSPWGPLVAAAALPLVVVAPWLAFNEANYHATTAGALAIREQSPIVNPHHLHYALSALPNETVSWIANAVLPAEWGTSLANQPALGYLAELLGVLLIPAATVFVLGTGRRLWTVPTMILGLPWVLVFLEMWDIRYGQQWSVETRYLFPVLPLLLALAARATDILRTQYLVVLVTLGATCSLAAIWAFLVFGFTGSFAPQ